MAIQFDEDNFGSRQSFTNDSTPSTKNSGSKIVNFLIKNGIVKDESSANIILIIVALLFIASSVYFFMFGFSLPQG